MAITALHSAATGMKAMDTQLDVIANNLANSNTHGFKSSRVNFEDLFYEEMRQPGSLNSQGLYSSTGLFVGLGVRVSNTQLNMETGSPENTGRPLDIAIQGEGFFRVQTPEGIGEGQAYTRAGNFIANQDGDLVLGTTAGPLLDPAITLPQGTDLNSVTIEQDGTITVMVDGVDQEIGQIQLFRFPNAHGLRQEGGNLYTETNASGSPIAGLPLDAGFGGLLQRHLEASNVDPVRELVQMIRTQRSFELNSQSIRAADENLQVVSRLRR
ncbi:MAG: flagellar basal-body rod protein FlgG [Sedimentisphaerales bacterium]|nr:flagellar basal-body rod protein FlgG [Sedimentisphaerales bacterium]